MLQQLVIMGVVLLRVAHQSAAAPGAMQDMAVEPAPGLALMPGPAPLPIIGPTEPVSRPLGAEDMNWFADYLSLLLHEDPWSENQAPLLYVETSNDLDSDGDGGGGSGGAMMEKRSRYYRRYPWKRVTSRSRNTYDPDAYLCNPSRDDVVQLLLALHEAREGNTSRTINFCNRRRPANAVFTNIRFIGRRK